MFSRVAFEPPSIRQDGFGVRTVEVVPGLGSVERLTLSPPLSSPGAEQAIRARAAHLMHIDPAPVARVLRVERAARLSILAPLPDGATLADVLAALEFGTLTLSNDEVLELATSVVRAAAALHRALGALPHGALSPGHVVIRRDATALFTGAVFADALQMLARSREALWREFGLVLPPAARAPQLDRRGDVVQLGSLVLATALRRALRRDEVPADLGALVAEVSLLADGAGNARLQGWLRDSLQLDGRVVFDSAGPAGRRFERLMPPDDEARRLALQTAILQLCGRPA